MTDNGMAAEGAGPAALDDGTHKKKALEAASFVVIGFGLSQVIRLGGNIVLTRLLVPEIFGILTLARVFFMGIGLFTDIGLEPSIIRSPRASDPVFVNTAWTIQILRNCILAAISILLGFPAAAIYKEPSLVYLVPVIGLMSIPDGFRSTSLVMMDKELRQKKLTYIELTIQVVSLSCMIVAAFFSRSVWSLLVGDFVGTVIRTVWSHRLNTSQPNRFMIEKESARELLSFGLWILLSTALMFLATQSDRFILGKLFPMAWFGVYSVALALAELPKQVISRMNGKVIFPLISKYAQLPREMLREKIGAARWRILLALAALLAVSGCFGDYLIYLLYDQRYQAAAWMLPLLAFGMWPLLLISTIDGSLLAIGKPNYGAMGNLAKFLYMVIALPLAYGIGGELAVILVIAANDLPSYLIINYGLARERLSLLRQDAWLTGLFAAMVGLLLGARMLVGLGLPGQAAFFHH